MKEEKRTRNRSKNNNKFFSEIPAKVEEKGTKKFSKKSKTEENKTKFIQPKEETKYGLNTLLKLSEMEKKRNILSDKVKEIKIKIRKSELRKELIETSKKLRDTSLEIHSLLSEVGRNI